MVNWLIYAFWILYLVSLNKYTIIKAIKQMGQAGIQVPQFNQISQNIRSTILPRTQSQEQQVPQQPQSVTNKNADYQLLIAHLRIILKQVLKQLKSQGEEVKKFETELKSSNKDIKMGVNFQGRVDQTGKIYGIAKYFSKKQNQCSLFFGQCINGVPVKDGIYFKVSINNNEIDKENYQAYYLYNWEITQEGMQRGCVIKKLEGWFKNGELHHGRLLIKQQDQVKMEYTGQFKFNRIQGRGTLIIPGKYKYDGNFQKQKKDGVGKQNDQIRHTQYIGQFYLDKRHGYGQLTYMNREKVKLKGFWTDGIMKSGDGMYVKNDGTFLEQIGDDIQLM